ncbi:MAG: cytochrome c [Anaerolineae bacterium]|nr:cytochrome c [Anaerolineae bacterium]
MRRLVYLFLILWLAACGGEEEKSKPAPTPDLSTAEGRGEVLFVTHCATCHAAKGDRKIVGPSLAGIATRSGERVPGESAEDYIYTSILHPDDYLVEGFAEGSMKQDFASVLTTENVDDLIAYLMTLR